MSEKNKKTFAEDLYEKLPKQKRNRVKKKKIIHPTYFSNTLQSYRQQAGFTQQELAKETGLAQCKISNYERGAQLPSKTNLLKIITVIVEPEKQYKAHSLITRYENEVKKRHAENYPNMK